MLINLSFSVDQANHNKENFHDHPNDVENSNENSGNNYHPSTPSKSSNNDGVNRYGIGDVNSIGDASGNSGIQVSFIILKLTKYCI